MQAQFARNCRATVPIFLLLSIIALPALAAPKTDIVILKNGDKFTGEVKSLKRGQLSLSTDAAGTIGIEWEKVANVISNQNVQVETITGARYFGHLQESAKGGRVVVESDEGPQILDSSRVILMTPIEGKGFDAWDIDVSLGYNFTKAGGVKQGSLGANIHYRTLVRIYSATFSTNTSDSDTQEASERSNLGLQYTRLWNNRWFVNGNLTLDQNDELGLNLRTSLGSAVGRFLIQSNSMLLSMEGGLQVASENLVAEEEDTQSVEGTFKINWDWFLFDTPDLDWSTSLNVYPSLTESGRVRAELDSGLKWEIINDLKWGISFYSSYDNQPQSDAGATSDYGVDVDVTYEF